MEIGTLFLNRYEILEKLGEGGMSTVYKAKCHLLERFVAIKVLKDEYARDGEFVQKFMQESRAVARLNHPNIVAIYDFHETVTESGDPRYVIVLEYIDGKTLKEVIQEEGSLSEPEATMISQQILSALQEAHRHQIIHRDIKPHNILITRQNIVKVTDFGIARAASAHTMTTPVEAIGSVHYFSPEQARGAYTDERTDIYSFGIVLYEMLTGKRPFTGENPVTVAMKHIQEDILPPRNIRPEISPAMEDIVLRCTEKKQAERFQNIDEILDAFSKVQSDQRIQTMQSAQDPIDMTQKINIENAASIDVWGEEKKVRIKPSPDITTPQEQWHDAGEYESLDQKKEKRLHIFPIFFGVLAAFIFTTVLYIGFSMVRDHRQESQIREIDAPDFMGKTLQEAQELAKQNDLQIEVEKEVSERNKPKGVVGQKPQPGMKIKQKSSVYLTLNVFDETQVIVVENYLDRDVHEVTKELAQQGVTLSITYEQSKELPKDKIIKQSPDAGATIRKGDKINVVVSSGGSEGKLKNCIGLQLDDAKAMLEGDGLSVQVKEAYSEETPSNVVMDQEPKPDTEFSSGAVITLTVSKGPDPQKNESKPQEEEHTKKPEEHQEGRKDFQLTVPIPTDKPETLIRVVRVLDGSREVVYERTCSRDEGSVNILLADEKIGAILELYVDDVLMEDFVVE